MAHRVGTKGQVVIEKEIRDHLGIEPGWTVVQLLVDGHVELHFIPPRHNRSLLGALAPYTDVRIPDEDDFRAARERARDERAAEIVARMQDDSCE